MERRGCSGSADGGVVVRVVRARWVARSWSLIVRVYVNCQDDILIRRVNLKRMCRDYDSLCRDHDSLCRDYDSSLPLINASAMVSPGTQSTASNQYYVPGMEYIIGTLILRSFRVLEEVSNTSTAGSPGTRSTASNQYQVPGMEYIIGTLILRSFRVLEEVSSTSTAGTAEYVPDSWYGVCNRCSDTSELRST